MTIENLLYEIYHSLNHIETDIDNNDIKSIKYTVNWCISKIDNFFENKD